MGSLSQIFSFDECGSRLKKILTVVFWINFVLMVIGWVVGALMLLFVNGWAGLLTLLLGWIPVAIEVCCVYVAMIPLGAFAELVENSSILVEQGYRTPGAAPVAEPEVRKPPVKEQDIPAWKRVEMEKAGIPVPPKAPKAAPAPAPTPIARAESAPAPTAPVKFDANKIPAWKRVQMEQEAAKNDSSK